MIRTAFTTTSILSRRCSTLSLAIWCTWQPDYIARFSLSRVLVAFRQFGLLVQVDLPCLHWRIADANLCNLSLGRGRRLAWLHDCKANECRQHRYCGIRKKLHGSTRILSWRWKHQWMLRDSNSTEIRKNELITNHGREIYLDPGGSKSPGFGATYPGTSLGHSSSITSPDKVLAAFQASPVARTCSSSA